MYKKIIALLLSVFVLLSAASCTDAQPADANDPAADAPQTSDTSDKDAEADSNKLSLSNPNASEEAVRLYNYICNTYRSGIISGQQESTWMGSEQYEFDYIFEQTGKYPALRGLDYMNDDFEGVNRRAKEWHDRGGIVTIC